MHIYHDALHTLRKFGLIASPMIKNEHYNYEAILTCTNNFKIITIDQSINRSIDSIDRSINQSIDRSIDQLINRSIDLRSIN